MHDIDMICFPFSLCRRGEVGFCKGECRDDYITEELRRDRQKRGREKVPTMVDDKDGDTSSIFFTCADTL